MPDPYQFHAHQARARTRQAAGPGKPPKRTEPQPMDHIEHLRQNAARRLTDFVDNAIAGVTAPEAQDAARELADVLAAHAVETIRETLRHKKAP